MLKHQTRALVWLDGMAGSFGQECEQLCQRGPDLSFGLIGQNMWVSLKMGYSPNWLVGWGT